MLTNQDAEQLGYYSTRVNRLRVNRSYGIAPHKPILLLTVLHLVKSGAIEENKIYLSRQLIDSFLETWSYLGSETHTPNIALPFFHLRGDKFWHLVPRPGFRKVLNSKIKLRTLPELNRVVKYAYLDDCLFQFLSDAPIRDSLEVVLVKRWFPAYEAEYQQLCSSRGTQGMLAQPIQFVDHGSERSRLLLQKIREAPYQ